MQTIVYVKGIGLDGAPKGTYQVEIEFLRNRKFLIEKAVVAEDGMKANFKPAASVPCWPKTKDQYINIYLVNEFSRKVAEGRMLIFFGFQELSVNAHPSKFFFEAQELS